MIRGGALLLAALLIAGCGLKGSLSLPEKPGDVAIRPASETPAAPEPPAAPPTPAPAPESEPEAPPTGTSRE